MRSSCTWKLSGTKTFRKGSTKILGHWGGNMQNYEKSLRKIYRPDGFTDTLKEKCLFWLQTGDLSVFTEEELLTINVFIQSDESGADALCVAYEAENKQFRQLFINAVKPHVYVALKLFSHVWKKKYKESGGLIEDLNIDEICDTPIKDLKKHPYWREIDALIKSSDNWSSSERYYYLAKQTCHSSNYGIEANTFRMNVLEKSSGKIYISNDDAKFFLESYRSWFPEIVERCRAIEQQIGKCGVIYNLFGHPYEITDYRWEDKLKEYYAWSPQSTVGQIVTKAVIDFCRYAEENNKCWDFLNDCHDSYLTQGLLVDVKERRDKMREFMNVSLVSPIDGTKFSMKSEQRVGFNWSDEKLDNPLGLRELTWI